ncbi:MAG: transcription elongation factor GreA [Candidatus Omnitrophica bacterium]|nr:transcription elongation factor GreA [Candidatus Omnitrophota bacterium]MBU1932304.1 transcription elongation factor GreA [Candidatus Omnitrophota bacterium]
MSENIFLTKEGYERLKKQLKELKGSKRREIAISLEKARLMGDLSENAEYDSAKQAQSVNEKRINELENKLAMARIVDEESIATDKAYVGAKVKLKDLDSGEDITYKLVTEDEADFGAGKISISSPVGKAFLGKKKGEVVTIKIPAGVLKYKIIDISR